MTDATRPATYKPAMITPEQMRDARATIDATQREIADAAGLTVTVYFKIETGATKSPRPSSVEWIREAFEARGVEFLPDSGVRLRR